MPAGNDDISHDVAKALDVLLKRNIYSTMTSPVLIEVRLVPYDSTWIAMARAEANRLFNFSKTYEDFENLWKDASEVLQPSEIDSVSSVSGYSGRRERDFFCHVGSTAVPGLPSKPYIDLLCPRLGDLNMAKAGYRKMGSYTREGDGTGWYLRKLVTPEAAIVGFIVHCYDPGAFEKALFVATLRANPALRTEYAALKARLSSTTTDFQMYTIGKTKFIAKMRTEFEIPVFYGAYGCANFNAPDSQRRGAL